ncbi:MAG: SUMF1/EgtB/PvdO family nonheme iron enzyme [Luminiphilus sp.]|nr:SUMF1/EgtB/PvdO family nonheme iron enzyme [Luminiphilus sp.]
MTPNDNNAPLTPGGFAPSQANDSERLTPTGFQPLDPGERPERPPLWPKIALGGIALVAAGVLFFLLTARSLEIQVDAVGTPRIDIDGLNVPFGQRYLIRPGQYRVTVTVPGYRDWQERVSVSDSDSQQLTVSPAILPGRVSIRSNPPGATVTVSGETLGQTPLEGLNLPAGPTPISVALARHQSSDELLEVTGRGIEQTLTLVLNPDWAEILVTAQPDDATLWIDDEPVSTVGTPVQVLSGDRLLSIRAPGYLDANIEVNVVAEVDQVLEPITLVPAAGILELQSSPAAANVTVDGDFMGLTPLSLELDPGRNHRIQVSKVGYNRARLEVSLEKGTTATRTVKLEPRLGNISFQLTPPDAQLWINGRLEGTGSQALDLPAVEQRVEVRLAGYASQRLRVTPREGLGQVVDIALLTEAEARKAALTPEITSALGQTLVLIDPLTEPMNSFSMGASRREPGRRSNEVLHTVELERAFYLATTETTNAQFRQFLESHDSGQIEGNSMNREHQPAVGMSWQQAARFCNWLSSREGLPPFYRETQGIIDGYNPSSTGYRLPTEAEWSYAARVEGEQYRKFAWGEDFPPSSAVVNVADNTSALVTGRILNGYADGYIVSAPVGSFPANHRGLYDMGGNVAEWVHDVYAIPSANAELATDPLGALKGDNYTVRGASWALSRLSELRLTYRDYGASGRDDLGFRIARYAE